MYGHRSIPAHHSRRARRRPLDRLVDGIYTAAALAGLAAGRVADLRRAPRRPDAHAAFALALYVAVWIVVRALGAAGWLPR